MLGVNKIVVVFLCLCVSVFGDGVLVKEEFFFLHW